MSIGVVSDKDFLNELTKIPSSHISENNKPKEPIEAEVLDSPIKGRPLGKKEVPDSLRQIIGETSVINGRQDAIELARQFGISKSSVSAYANGSTSTKSYNESKPSIQDHINRSKERITNKAKNRLVLALNQITEEKLANAKLKDVSSVAKDMSSIIKDFNPTETGPNINGPQFIFYAPIVKKEKEFETITINE